MSNLNLKGIWIPIEILTDDKLSDKEKIIEKLEDFLLELGKGFTFVRRQYPIYIGNDFYHADLVFYHRILKCFVIIDLKINKVARVL